jgi:CBS domain-containing protein
MKKHRLRVRDIMSTAVLSMREGDVVSQVVREMTLAAVRHMPVVDAHDHLIGIISSSDVVAALERGGDPTLRSIMTKQIVSVTPDTPADEAVAMMIERRVHALPVLDASGALVGIVTATDFLVVAHQALTGAPMDRLPSEI